MIRSMRLAAALALGVAVAGMSGPAARAADPALSPAQTEAINKLIHDYIVAHPEVLVESLKSLDAREQANSEADRQKALTERKAELFQDPGTPVGGNPNGSVTIVEFFDFRCPYCKAMIADLNDLVKSDGSIRFVYKDFPILGPASQFAAKVALAANLQGKYVPVHDALMSYKGQLDDDTVLQLAGKAGADVTRLKADMDKPEIADQIARNLDLAQALHLGGTPGFVIGSTVIDGAVPIAKMKEMVAAARKG
jgi:protein-disulfide isomerase